jgi:CheY-like chemotaxis protein
MKLEFQLLVVDDDPSSIGNAVNILKDHLESKGFSLQCKYADDLTDEGIRALARQSGLDFNLVAVDYNLGQHTDGANAAQKIRHELRYTDMVFYSSDPTVDLHDKLAKQQVPGVFVATRIELDEVLKGLADTVIGKAVDLNHMRGIAMAEVAEMDVLMGEVLEAAFTSDDTDLKSKAKRTLEDLLKSAEKSFGTLQKIALEGTILRVLRDGNLFSSMHRYKALSRASRCITNKPTEAINTLKTYDTDILEKRNTLAHAKEDIAADGVVTLRSIRHGQPPVTIDDAWMASFRGKLRMHRTALDTVCNALKIHIEARNTSEPSKG